MKLTVIASSSKGNGYLLHTGGEALVLEAGVRLMEVKKALDFQVGKIRGAIITHAHLDHSKYVLEYANAGIDVLAPSEVFKVQSHRFKCVKPGKGYALGGFKVVPFEVPHDTTCFCYLIDHADCGKILFLTDTYLCEYVFPDLRHIIIEANYADDILEENILNGLEHPSKRLRLLTSHMELQTTKAFIKAQDLSLVQNIILIHLSDNNSHTRRFHYEITALTGKQVYVAHTSLEIDLSKNLF